MRTQSIGRQPASRSMAERAASKTRPTRERVVWTDEEKDRLASLATSMRLNDPWSATSSLINRAMEQLPEGRRRTLVTQKDFKPILDRMCVLFESLKRDAREVESARAKLADVKSAEELLQELSDDDVLRQYGDRVMRLLSPDDLISAFPGQMILSSMPSADIVAEAARRIYSDVQCSPVAQLLKSAGESVVQEVAVSSHRARVPKVFVVGPKANQQQEITKKCGSICDLVFSENGYEKPGRADIVVRWVRFTNHATREGDKALVPPRYFVEQMGGVNNLIESIQSKVKLWQSEFPSSRIGQFVNGQKNGRTMVNGAHSH